MFSLRNNLFTKSLREVFRLLTARQRKSSYIMLALVFVSGILDVLGLASILPIISITMNKSIIHSNEYLNAVYTFMGFADENNFLLFLFLTIPVIFLTRAFIALAIHYLQARFSFNLAMDISSRLFHTYFLKQLQFFIDHNSMELVRNIFTVPFQFSAYIILPIFVLISEGVVALLVVSGIAAYDFKVFLLMAITIFPTTIIFYNLIRKKIQYIGEKRDELAPKAINDVHQGIKGYVDVKLLHKEDYFVNTYLAKQDIISKLNVRLTVFRNTPVKVIEIAALTGVVLLFIYATFFSTDPAKLIPLLGVYVTAAYRIIPSVNKVMSSLMLLKEYQFVYNIFAEIKSQDQANKEMEPPALSFADKISIKDVSFKYPEAEGSTLNHISLDIKKGEKVGFIGRSGSGKTTLMNLLLRFVKEDEGSIWLDDVQLTDNNLIPWRSLVGYVQQNVFIIEGTVAENIAFGIESDEVDHDRLTEVIRLAKLDDVVKELPKGVHTNIGENGAKFSGGQRQRIAIARALYHDAQILIFDEATSALDNETEEEITAAIREISQMERTVIIIAHRYTTLKNCDRIFEMENGSVSNSFSYKELKGRMVS